MSVPARLYGPDREEILAPADWPRGGASQAPAWFAGGPAQLPDEITAALSGHAEFDSVNARPAHVTRIDDRHEHRHDVFACLRSEGRTCFVAGIVSDPADAERLAAAAAATQREAEARGVEGWAVVVHRPGHAEIVED
jgi:hypothetical protein